MTNTEKYYGTFDKDKGWSLPPREVYEKAARKGDKDMKKELRTDRRSNHKPRTAGSMGAITMTNRAHTHTPEIDNIIRTAILTPTLNRPEIRESCAFIEQEAQKVKQHNHDLLEALRWALDLIDIKEGDSLYAELEHARNAIAKAEGSK